MLQRRFLSVLATAALVCSAVTFSAPRAVSAQGDVYLQEDFTDDSNGWEAQVKNGNFDIADNIMTVEVTAANKIFFITPDETFPGDVAVSVDVQAIRPDSELWTAGIIARATARDGEAAFYELDIDGAGKWVFAVRTKDGDTYDTVDSGRISGFNDTKKHSLGMTITGESFTFLVDGEEVGTAENATLDGTGDDTYVGLIAGTYEGLDNLTVEFSNLTVAASGSAVLTGTDEPTPSVSGSDKVGTLIKLPFSDRFRNNNNEWDEGSGKFTTAVVEDGALKLDISTEGYFALSKLPYTLPEDYTLSVDVEVPDGDQSENWNAGIAFRISDEGTKGKYLQFEITGAGEWSFLSFDADADKPFETIDSGTLDTFDGAATHTIEIVASGTRYTFNVDGTRVARITSDFVDSADETQARIGLFGGTFTGLDTQSFLFTNFSVTE